MAQAQFIHAGAESASAQTPDRHVKRPAGWLAGVVVMGLLGVYHWTIYTSRPDMPHRFAILDMLFRIGVAGVIVFLGLLVGLRMLGRRRITNYLSRAQIVALGTGLGLGAISLLTLVLGVLHLYYGVTFAALLTAGPLLFPNERRWAVTLAKETIRAARDHRRRPLTFERLACYLLGGISLAAMALCYLRDLTLPDGGPGYDSYQYHWAIPALLMRAHTWQAFAGWAHANLPFNTEMLNLIALSLRAPTAANIVQDTFLALSGLLIYDLTRRYFGPVVAWFTVVSPMTIPLLVAYTSQSFVETALYFYGFATLVLLLLWIERRLGMSRAGFEALALAGVFLGLAIASKYTALEYAPGLVLILLAGCVVMLWRERGASGGSARLWRAALLAMTFAIGAFVVIAPWLVKNWMYIGNPVYPALGSIFPDPLWNAARDQTLLSTFRHFGPHTGPVARYHLYALDLFFDPAPYHENAPYTMGQIALAAPLALPALGFRLWHGGFADDARRRGQMLVIAGLTALGVIGMVVWNFSGALVARYALPPLVFTTTLGALLTGWLALATLERVKTRGSLPLRLPARILSVIVLLVVATGLANQVVSHLYLNLRVARNPLPLVTGAISEDQYQISRVGGGMTSDYWQLVSYLNTTLPHDGKLLMLARGSGYFFSNRQYVADSGGDWIPYLVSAGKTPDGILRILRAQGYTYVVYDASLMHWLEHGYENRVLQADVPVYLAFQQSHLIFIASWGSISLYRVPPVSNG